MDEDSDNPTDSYYDEDDSVALHFGHAATAAEEQTIASLARQYLTDAATADGVKACRLIYSVRAEAIPDMDGNSPVSTALRGNTCGVVMSKLFKQQRPKLAHDLAALDVVGARVEGDRGVIILNFGRPEPPGLIRLRREGQRWTVDDQLPSVIP